MGCGNSKQDSQPADDEQQQQQQQQQRGSSADGGQRRRSESDKPADDFDGGVAPTDDGAEATEAEQEHRRGPTDPAYASAKSDAPNQPNPLAGFTFGQASENEHDAFSGTAGFVAFGGGEEDVSGATSGDPAPAGPRKPRRIAVSDECAEADDANWSPPVVDKSPEDRALIASVLRHNPLLQSLDGEDLRVVVDAMAPMDFRAGHRVLEQGGDGGMHYYVIAAGQVEIIKNNQLVCTFSEGQGFGEMELMYVQPCVATVRCRVDTRTWALDRKTYKKVVMRLAIERRKLYSELLGNVEFLENMSEYERQTLADALSPVTFEAGESLIRRGERNEWMFIVIDGVVEVLGAPQQAAAEDAAEDGGAATAAAGGDGGRLVHITDLERGSCVGELEFLNQHPAVADCVAKTTLRACKLHRDHFELCMGPVTDVLRRTVRQDKYAYYREQLDDMFAASASPTDGNLAAPADTPAMPARRRHRQAVSAEADADEDAADWAPRVVEKDAAAAARAQQAVRRCPLFRALDDDDARVVADALEPVSFESGQVILAEGEVPDEAFWYVVASGSVAIKQRAAEGDADGPAKELAMLGPGQSFGELQLMYTTPSMTSAVALGDGVECFRLDRRTYRRLLMKVTIERRQQYRELLAGVPFLHRLSEPQQLNLADALSPIAFTPGELLCRHGSVNEWMFIVVDGVVEVFAADGGKVCELRRGEMVGELEFFNRHKCVANCVAKTHVKACRLHREHFEACMGPVGGFVDELLRTEKYAYYDKAAKEAEAAE